jgi:hypothetical protein
MSNASECYELLRAISHRQMPVVFTAAADIHKILALRSARLIEAETSMPVYRRNGELRIERAEVTAVTPAGRATFLSLGAGPPSRRSPIPAVVAP